MWATNFKSLSAERTDLMIQDVYDGNWIWVILIELDTNNLWIYEFVLYINFNMRNL